MNEGIQNGTHEPRHAASGASSLARTQEYCVGSLQESVPRRADALRTTASRGRPLAPLTAARQHLLQQQQMEAEEEQQIEDVAAHSRQQSDACDAIAKSQSISWGTHGPMADAEPTLLLAAADDRSHRPRVARGRGGRLMTSSRSALSNCNPARILVLCYCAKRCCCSIGISLVRFVMFSRRVAVCGAVCLHGARFCAADAEQIYVFLPSSLAWLPALVAPDHPGLWFGGLRFVVFRLWFLWLVLPGV